MKNKISSLKRGTLIEVNKNFPYHKEVTNKRGRVTKIIHDKLFRAKLGNKVYEILEDEFEIIPEGEKYFKSLYLVPWIEVEYGWGDRPEGYKVFESLENCIKETKKDSENGNYEGGGGYFGPLRGLCYYEIPYDKTIANKSFVDELPKFRSERVAIK